MDLEFSSVARAQMAAEGIHRLEVEAIVASPDSVVTGDWLIRYDGQVAGRALSVFVVADSDPPKVALLVVR